MEKRGNLSICHPSSKKQQSPTFSRNTFQDAERRLTQITSRISSEGEKSLKRIRSGKKG